MNDKNKRGFTLIETVLAIGLGILASTMITAFVIRSFTVIHEVKQREAVHSNALSIINSFNYWIKQSKDIEIKEENIGSSEVITIEITLPDSVKTFIKDENKDIKIDGEPINSKKVQVQDLEFSELNNSVRIKLSLKAKGATDSYFFSTTIAKRNNH